MGVSASLAIPILGRKEQGRQDERMITIQRSSHYCSPATPVGALTHSNCIDTLVNSCDSFSTVNVCKDGPSARRRNPGRGLLVTGNFCRLHAGAEALKDRHGQFWSHKPLCPWCYLPIVAYACAIPPPIPPSKPAEPGLIPWFLATFSISAAVKRRTAPLVDASIQA